LSFIFIVIILVHHFYVDGTVQAFVDQGELKKSGNCIAVGLYTLWVKKTVPLLFLL